MHFHPHLHMHPKLTPWKKKIIDFFISYRCLIYYQVRRIKIKTALPYATCNNMQLQDAFYVEATVFY